MLSKNKDLKRGLMQHHIQLNLIPLYILLNPVWSGLVYIRPQKENIRTLHGPMILLSMVHLVISFYHSSVCRSNGPITLCCLRSQTFLGFLF